jgi:two-component system, NtrC family, response regulator PilR
MSSERTVLVVDDSQDLTEVVAEYLGIYGYTVYTASNGNEALECLKNREIRIVVSDIHMPGMDGLTLMGEIKARYPGLPVILITGFSVSEARKIALGKGADAFVAKPFRMKELKDVLESFYTA